MRLLLTRQSELLNSSSQHPCNLSMYRGVFEFYKAWCGSYHINVGDKLQCFPLAHCKVATQVYQKIVGQCKLIHGLCAMPKLEQANMALQHQHAKGQRRSSSSPQCGVWVLVVPWRHQALCVSRQEEVCSGRAYRTQSVAYEYRYQPIKWGGVDAQGCEFPIAIEREARSSRQRLTSIGTLPIPQYHFDQPSHPYTHPTTRY